MLEIDDFDISKYQPTPVIYELRQSIFQKLKAEEDILPDIDGREETKRDVIRAILSGANPYLVSEEGTGKTRLAKSLTRLLSYVPVIKGCPYHDDPKWEKDWLCPRCAESENPSEEFGIDFISGEKRFSRIQGNEYTNYAKILGVKDIQVIREGKSPTDPRAFTGTGVFHGNRGILFVADLPSIPTNVQVLFHPILEERKVILEEYNIERPIDFLLIATGNPEGFSHVNKIPRPLLDRLELIHMDLPERDVGLKVMLKEKSNFNVNGRKKENGFKKQIFWPDHAILERNVAAPWWIVDVVGKSVRETRKSINLDKGASIRGIYKAMDHTYATAEMDGRHVANLRDACEGLKLALRGRVKIRADLIGFGESPKESFERSNKIVEDITRYITRKIGEEIDMSEEIASEINSLLLNGTNNNFNEHSELKKMVDKLCEIDPVRAHKGIINEAENMLFFHPDKADEAVIKEYYYSAIEMIINFGVHKGIVEESMAKERVFIPERFIK